MVDRQAPQKRFSKIGAPFARIIARTRRKQSKGQTTQRTNDPEIIRPRDRVLWHRIALYGFVTEDKLALAWLPRIQNTHLRQENAWMTRAQKDGWSLDTLLSPSRNPSTVERLPSALLAPNPSHDTSRHHKVERSLRVLVGMELLLPGALSLAFALRFQKKTFEALQRVVRDSCREFSPPTSPDRRAN
eukprot:GABV01009300.1.p1 GENE.GABV01009300.1~~GABV01009300.1.p1  ORF type:complete len:188 (+),score=13.36 GABV01009300.1:64-627(+)